MEEQIVRVADVMKTTLHMISGLATVQEAIDRMNALKVTSLVIERRDENDEYGVVTVQDIAAKVVAVNRSTQRTSVYQIMTKPTLTVHPEMNVKYAIRLLADHRHSRALVRDGATLLGFIAMRDLVLSYKETSPEQTTDQD